ncbi:MAG TPA: XdhC family protein [Alphaproteobacteria bacterium]|nr:XdhC family protein [Alphaproteobacteria bacterium]
MAAPDDVLEAALLWRRAGRGVALATVVETWGSAPRRPGARMAVDDSLAMQGSVSGGCVEVAVAEAAQAVIRDGGARLLEFGVTDAQARAAGLACGGRLRVLVERLE